MSLYILGLPLTPETVTDEFLSFINQPNVILIQSSIIRDINHHNDYITAKIGYDLLFSLGYEFTETMPTEQSAPRVIYMKQMWETDRSARLVAQQIVDCYKQIQINNPTSVIASNHIGSPDLYDDVYPCLKKINIITTVINTRSSAEIAIDYLLSRGLIPDLELNILSFKNISDVKKDSINIFGCLGTIYGLDISVLLSKIISTFGSNAKIFKIKLSETVDVEHLTKIQLFKRLINHREEFNCSLLVIVN